MHKVVKKFNANKSSNITALALIRWKAIYLCSHYYEIDTVHQRGS